LFVRPAAAAAAKLCGIKGTHTRKKCETVYLIFHK